MSLRNYLLILLLPGLFGCASKQVVSQPSEITLDRAVAEVAKALQQVKAVEQDTETGLIPAEVVLTFNITASGEDNQKLYLELAPDSGQSSKGGAETTSGSSASRGNQITITFKNLLLTDDETLLSKKTPEEINELIKAVKMNMSRPSVR